MGASSITDHPTYDIKTVQRKAMCNFEGMHRAKIGEYYVAYEHMGSTSRETACRRDDRACEPKP